MKQTNQDVKLLPIATVLGREFLVDIDNREFRDFDDSKNVIKMHSDIGRRITRIFHGILKISNISSANKRT